MVTEHDEVDGEFEHWPASDPVREAIGRLLVAIIENTAPGSRTRAKAMSEALQAHERISAAIADKRVLN
jgi:hypothetical protein